MPRVTDPARPVPRRAAAAVTLGAAAVLLAAGAAGCGTGRSAGHARAGPAASRTAGAARKVTIPAADQPACARLLAQLQQVTLTISASSELIASSVNKQQLSQRIGAEAVRLRQSADALGKEPPPAVLAAADRQLITALRALSGDFARAGAPARRGDFRAAVDAMGDKPAVDKVAGASATIQKACR